MVSHVSMISSNMHSAFYVSYICVSFHWFVRKAGTPKKIQ